MHASRGAPLILLLVLSGCGVMQMPMPVRLAPDAQADMDEAWNKAMGPPDRLSTQALLDALLIS